MFDVIRTSYILYALISVINYFFDGIRQTLYQNFTGNLMIIFDSSISLHLIATDKLYNGIFEKKFDFFI